MHKRCNTCKQEKPIEEFTKQSDSKDGLRYSCKACLKQKGIIYRKNHKIICRLPDPITIKICAKCKQEKDIEEFGKSSNNKDGLKTYCKLCRKQEHAKRHTSLYGIKRMCTKCKQEKDIEEFDRSYINKDGRKHTCKVCRSQESKIYLQNKKRAAKNSFCLVSTIMTKTCVRCKQEKFEEEFEKQANKNIHKQVCKSCREQENETSKKVVVLSGELIKQCSRCKQEKPFGEFYVSKQNSNQLLNPCRQCLKEIRKSPEYKQKFSERDITNRKKYHTKNKRKLNERTKKYHQEHKQERNQKLKLRRETDLEFKILTSLRNRVRDAIKRQGTTKSQRTIDLIGCSVPYLIKHIESMFDNKMTWDNYGYYGWHIDHVIPCAYFDLTKPEEQKKCFHYSNMQPLWGRANYEKSSWYNGKYYTRAK